MPCRCSHSNVSLLPKPVRRKINMFPSICAVMLLRISELCVITEGGFPQLCVVVSWVSALAARHSSDPPAEEEPPGILHQEWCWSAWRFIPWWNPAVRWTHTHTRLNIKGISILIQHSLGHPGPVWIRWIVFFYLLEIDSAYGEDCQPAYFSVLELRRSRVIWKNCLILSFTLWVAWSVHETPPSTRW